MNSFMLYNVAMGATASVGLVYLVYAEEFVMEYRRFLLVTTAGLLTFSVGAPLFALFVPTMVHVVYALASLLVILGLYSPIRNDLRTDEWAALLWKNPRRIRHRADWMAPMDDRILELFHSSSLVLTPSIIALNIDHSREGVNRRLSKLEDHGFVEKVDRGKYRITETGQNYLKGDTVSASSTEQTERARAIVR